MSRKKYGDARKYALYVRCFSPLTLVPYLVREKRCCKRADGVAAARLHIHNNTAASEF